MNGSKDLVALNLFLAQNHSDILADKILQEARKRYLFGQLIKFCIILGFLLTLFVEALLILILSLADVVGLIASLYLSIETANLIRFTIYYSIVVGFIVCYFFIPGLISLPFSFYLSLSWHNPYNLVMLRPFSRKNTNNALKYLIKNGLCGLGFFYTLADSQIRQKWYVIYPILLGQLSLFQFRLPKIKSDKSVKKIKLILGQKRRRIYNWSVSKSKIFPLTCSDECWQDSVRELFACADIILIDLTGFHPNVWWEIDECERLDLLKRVIFVADHEDESKIVAGLRDSGLDFINDVVFYGANLRLDIHQILFQVARKLPNLERPEFGKRSI